ncbi:MAG TPA: hypothetical protein DDW76_07895 [Cyanobacteria bacterium UBA11369]|nr:hypothetical protein [Cyanobacteria bacterium UBA8553]HAZ43103.1 hypothetical protein [Cyanobacteria bacterium UBA11371]HBE35684.1 hypothetical protein [Cyanobacteria bacterium UBA11368]HBE48703.1 hypothetical protein [Cyanobacteria bacterium UBA11369]
MVNPSKIAPSKPEISLNRAVLGKREPKNNTRYACRRLARCPLQETPARLGNPVKPKAITGENLTQASFFWENHA